MTKGFPAWIPLQQASTFAHPTPSSKFSVFEAHSTSYTRNSTLQPSASTSNRLLQRSHSPVKPMLSQRDKARFEKLKVARLLPISRSIVPRPSAALTNALEEGECSTSPRRFRGDVLLHSSLIYSSGSGTTSRIAKLPQGLAYGDPLCHRPLGWWSGSKPVLRPGAGGRRSRQLMDIYMKKS